MSEFQRLRYFYTQWGYTTDEKRDDVPAWSEIIEAATTLREGAEQRQLPVLYIFMPDGDDSRRR